MDIDDDAALYLQRDQYGDLRWSDWHGQDFYVLNFLAATLVMLDEYPAMVFDHIQWVTSICRGEERLYKGRTVRERNLNWGIYQSQGEPDEEAEGPL